MIASNNLAISLAMGTFTPKKEHLKIVLVFGVFEFVIPLAGVLIGQQLANFIQQYASIFGSIILTLLGCYIIVKSLINNGDISKIKDKILNLKGLIVLAMGLSIDNLIVGFGLGLKDVNPILFAAVISLSSMIFSLLGLKLGKYFSNRFRVITEVLSGILLICLGIATYF